MSAAVFNIAKAKDQYGNEIEPIHDYVSGVIRYFYQLHYECLT